jgi:hypothetical protein
MKKLLIVLILSVMGVSLLVSGCAKKHTVNIKLKDFSMLYASSKKFLKNGNNLKDILPQYLEQKGYLSKSFGYKTGKAADNWTQNGGWIGQWTCRNKKGQCFGIGIDGNVSNLKSIIAKYRSKARQIFFPYPKIYNVKNNKGSGQLLIVFREK